MKDEECYDDCVHKAGKISACAHSRPFAILWAGQTISAFGNGVFLTALAWQVVLLTHSATALGIILIAQSIPLLIFLLIGGIAADRLPRRLVLFWSDMGRAIVVLLITILSWTNTLQLWHLVVLGLSFGVVGAFFGTPFQAIPPQLVAADDLASANALTQLSGQTGNLLGPVLGAACVALGSPATAFGFDGLTFVISAISLFFVRISAQMVQHEQEKHALSTDVSSSELSASKAKYRRTGIRKIGADLNEGLRYILDSPWLLMTIIVLAIGSLGSSGPLAVALPKLIHDAYQQGVWLFGAVGTSIGIGWIASTFFVGQVHFKWPGRTAFLMRSVASFAFIFLGLPLPHASEPYIAITVGILFGFGTGTLQTIWVTLLHKLVPNDKLGRVSSIDLLGSLCLLPISYLIAGILTDHIGPSWVFIAGGILNLILNSIALSVRDVRNLT